MLARAHRLTAGRDFAETIRRGRRAGTSTVVLHLAAGEAQEAEPRVGLVVGKTVGNAVTRNQVKRRLRHLVRQRLSALPRGTVLVLRALPPAATGTSATLARDVDAALHRVLGGRS
jgi:ribonuclease P protein component